jgi:hypothetical protein
MKSSLHSLLKLVEGEPGLSPDVVEDQREISGEAAVLIEAPAGPPGDGAQRIEVVAQPLLGTRGYGRRSSRRLFGVEVEQGLLHNALALGGVGTAPGRGEPAQLPCAHRGGGLTEPLDELRAVS